MRFGKWVGLDAAKGLSNNIMLYNSQGFKGIFTVLMEYSKRNHLNCTPFSQKEHINGKGK